LRKKFLIVHCHRRHFHFHWTGIIQNVKRGFVYNHFMKFELHAIEPVPESTHDELAKVVLARFGLLPKKRDAKAKFTGLLLELYERKKAANRERKPELSVMTVEQMAAYAGIARQTMYDYLTTWKELQVLKKTSFVNEGKVVIGYELNGQNLEGAFRKADNVLRAHSELSLSMIRQLQNEIKKEKLRAGIVEDESSDGTSSMLTNHP